jgi:hydrogenase expression/formation protein HypE
MSKKTGNNETIQIEGAVCPVPLAHHEKIVVGHGGGGKLSHDLIAHLFLPQFDNPILRQGDDAGVFSIKEFGKVAISTDSHVVWPLFFPGGDIGRLAVCGTVNDLAVMGAVPQFLTAGFILEEGLDVHTLEKIIHSMQSAAEEAGVQIIAGDTKVVQKGKADGLYINTSGIGTIPDRLHINGSNAQPGDVVILSGTIGDHGIAVLSARGDLGFEADVVSDIAPLNHLVEAMVISSSTERHEDTIHAMRDPTRGGLASTLNEIASQSKVGIILEEKRIPIKQAVLAACEMLGFDPLYIANEGKLLAIVHREAATEILEVMNNTRYGEEAAIIGEVISSPAGRVLMRTSIGSTRVVDIPTGEILPRIC